MEHIKITDDFEEQIAIGKKIYKQHPEQYTKRRMLSLKNDLDRIFPQTSDDRKMTIFYNSVYNYWVYGNNLRENIFYGFQNKSHEEKKKYITFRNRFRIYSFLNNKNDENIFKRKYETYLRFADAYKRDVIVIESPNDFKMFSDFVDKHPVFYVKPESLGLGIGVHKEELSNWVSKEDLFNNLLKECGINSQETWAIGKQIVLEEPIIQSEGLGRMHPSSVNMIRLTTIVNEHGGVDLVDAWYRVGMHGNDIAAASEGEIYTGVNIETGVVDTNGFTEFGDVFKNHPDTGIQFIGYEIPNWSEAIQFAKDVALRVPSVRYVGWDLALTDERWVIIEGNENGEFLGQLIYNKPYKEYIEKMIGLEPTDKYWWE